MSVDKGYALLDSRSLIAIHGPDAAHFLQGLTTANIPTSFSQPISHASTQSTQAIYSAFLNAQGRILNDVFIYPLYSKHTARGLAAPEADPGDPIFLIEVDREQVPKLVAWLKRYKLRSKVKTRTLSPQEVGVYAAWSPSTPRKETELQDVNSLQQNSQSPSRTPDIDPSALILTAQDTRTTLPWHRVLAQPPSTSTSQEEEQVKHALSYLSDEGKEVHELAYTINRYLHGVPEGQAELHREESLIHDSNVDLMGGVDFRKGCYVGQELTIRTQHTGVVRKRIMPVQIWEGPDTGRDQAPGADRIQPIYDGREREGCLLEPGTDLKAEGINRSAGKFVAGVGNVGLALCRFQQVLERAGESGPWTGRALKLKVEGRDLWMKAFVPAWWEQRGKVMEGGYESLKANSMGERPA